MKIGNRKDLMDLIYYYFEVLEIFLFQLFDSSQNKNEWFLSFIGVLVCVFV